MWAKSLTPVDNANQLGDTHAAVAADGAVFTTGTYNQNITFGGKTITNDDKITSAYVAKYNADGSEAWLAATLGLSYIRTLDTDADGNVYIAGVLADQVTFYSADNNNQVVVCACSEYSSISCNSGVCVAKLVSIVNRREALCPRCGRGPCLSLKRSSRK